MADRHPDEAKITALPARRLSKILADLAGLRGHGELASLPVVTLHLVSGRDLTGRILDLVDGEGLLLHVPGPGRHAPDWDVTYVEPRTVEAITVHEAPRVAAALSGGKVPSSRPRSTGGPAPSRLEVRRALAARQKTLAEALGRELSLEVDWDATPAEGEALRALAELISAGVEALVQVAKEALGRDALAEKVERVRFADGERADATLSGRTLTIYARLAFGPEGRLADRDLVSAIEKAL